MALTTMGRIAVGRDLTPHGNGAGSFAQVLVAQIPGEALVAYTTLLALFSRSGDSYVLGRWVLYGATVAVCGVIVLTTYLAQRDYEFHLPRGGRRNGRLAQAHLPILPMVSAMLAMAAYGLTVPGSPLQAAVSADGFAMCSASLAVAGAVAMTILSPFLSTGNAARVAGSVSPAEESEPTPGMLVPVADVTQA
jgi:hypothetical protein